jgi:hypothetical protein
MTVSFFKCATMWCCQMLRFTLMIDEWNEALMEWFWQGKPKYWEKTLSQCHLITHMDLPGTEQRFLQCEGTWVSRILIFWSQYIFTGSLAYFTFKVSYNFKTFTLLIGTWFSWMSKVCKANNNRLRPHSSYFQRCSIIRSYLPQVFLSSAGSPKEANV